MSSPHPDVARELVLDPSAWSVPVITLAVRAPGVAASHSAKVQPDPARTH